MTSIMPLHTAHRKNNELTSASVKARFCPSAVMKRPSLSEVMGESRVYCAREGAPVREA
jgi:hypothetical protein